MSDDKKPTVENPVMYENRRQRELAVQRMRQFTGRVYPKLEAQLMNLSNEALMDLVRFISDGQQEVTRAKNQAIHQPWRR